MKNYDVILVGAGIANVMSALSLVGTSLSVLIIEQGNSVDHRDCLKDKCGKCANCNPCRVTSGFGGAGFMSDCKLTYTNEVGGEVAEYIGIDNFNRYMKSVGDIFTLFKAKDNVVYNEEFANSFKYECSKHSLNLIKSPIRHLGTDGARDVMRNIYDYLHNASNVTVLCNSTVTNINFENKLVTLKTGETIQGKYISIAVGRSGSEWLTNLCKHQGIKVITGDVDIGVRVECPRSIMDNVTDNLYEFKILYNSSTGNTCRTFCVNPGGLVVRENYDGDIACVNGHSLSDNGSNTTNFAILVSCHFTEPFNEPIEYGKRICKLTNMLSDGKPMVQRLVDLKAYKRSTPDRMKRLVYKPTLSDCEAGDLRYVLPSNIIDSILEFVEKLDTVIPGINGNDTIFYAPECKFSSAKIDLTNTLENEKYKNIFFAGDSAGISRGIMQAAIAGRYIAQEIKSRENN